MHVSEFQQAIQEGIPAVIPAKKAIDPAVNHAPKRKEILSTEEKKLALQNALRYFPKEQHSELIVDFLEELETVGRIYMHLCTTDFGLSRKIGTGQGDYAHDTEQPGSCCGTTSA
jgi:urocanate hydratase